MPGRTLRGQVAKAAAFAKLLVWYGHLLYRRIWGFVRTDAAEDMSTQVTIPGIVSESAFATRAG